MTSRKHNDMHEFESAHHFLDACDGLALDVEHVNITGKKPEVRIYAYTSPITRQLRGYFVGGKGVLAFSIQAIDSLDIDHPRRRYHTKGTETARLK